MYAYYESHFDPYYPLPPLIHSYLSSFPKSYYLFHIKFHIAKPLLRVVKKCGNDLLLEKYLSSPKFNSAD